MRLLLPVFLLFMPMAASAQEAGKSAPEVETIHSDAPYYVETVKVDGNWIARGTRPKDYEMGIGTTSGTLGPEAFVITAKPDAGSGYRNFGALMQMHKPGPFLKKHIRMSARLKSDNVHWAAMWLRIDSRMGSVLYNMDDRPILGTTDWTRYQIVLNVPANAVAVAYGFLVAGGVGTVWMDGLTLEAVDDDVPVSVMGRRAAFPD